MRELHVIDKESVIADHYDQYIKENGAVLNGGLYNGDIFIESAFHQYKDYNKVTYIGSFSVEEDEPVSEEKVFNQIKIKKKVIDYGIYVYSGEGPVPHFHIISNDGGREFDGCMCIYEAKFFDHGVHTSILNSKELKLLDAFLRTQYVVSGTKWDYLSLVWQASNEAMSIKYKKNIKTSVQPDYTKTSGFVKNPDYY